MRMKKEEDEHGEKLYKLEEEVVIEDYFLEFMMMMLRYKMWVISNSQEEWWNL